MRDRSNHRVSLIAGILLLWVLDAVPGSAGCLIPISCTLGQPCDDFNIFTFAERCIEQCDGSTCCFDPFGGASTCECDLECPAGTRCVTERCLIQPTSTPTPTSGTPTATRTRTRTRTPTAQVQVAIQDASVREADSDVGVSFIITLSRALEQDTVFGLTVSSGSATQNVDYALETGNGVAITNASENITFGSVRIPANTTATGNLGFRIVGDNLLEINETFFVSLTVPPSMIGSDTSATGTILNDDTLPTVRNLGIAELLPQQFVTRAGQPTSVVVSWTHPHRWRDLATIDLRLRGASDTVFWVRFDEAANTFALVDPATGSPGPGVAPGTPGELAGAAVGLLVEGSRWQETGSDAAEVEVRLALRFVPGVSSGIYQVEAAATDDNGTEQEFESVGAIVVAGPLPCPGDCNNDGTVRVDELLRGVSIVLGKVSLAECLSFDLTPNGALDISEIVAGVVAALRGCAEASQSASRSAGP